MDVDLDLDLVAVVVSVVAEVLAGASGPALDGVGAMGEASAGAELNLHGEAGNILLKPMDGRLWP